jgi:pyruvate-ferredoxin/flavodoxin oxidoreductase
MQSEGGVAGAVHGALQTGSLATTFTRSQGLLLMIPNMYKIAGELTRPLFSCGRAIFGRPGAFDFRRPPRRDGRPSNRVGHAVFASVQEAMDFAAISQAATLKSRIPVPPFFDGFRTSHEVQKVAYLEDDVSAP